MWGWPERSIVEEEREEAEPEAPQCRVVTPLVAEPADPGELPRWRLRGMWELASVLNFLQVSALDCIPLPRPRV